MGIRVTHEQVVTVTGFSKRGVSPTAAKTVAGLLVLLTTFNEVVLPGANFTKTVISNIAKTFNRVVVLKTESCRPCNTGLKLAKVFIFTKTTGGRKLAPTNTQQTKPTRFKLRVTLRNGTL